MLRDPRTRRIRPVWLLLATVFLMPAFAAAEPPKVIKAEPDNGDVDVDPGLKEIRVEFDQDMKVGSHSWVGGGPNFPKTTGKPKWINARVAVMPVELEPDQDYWLSINSGTFTNFVGKNGQPAEPYPISFRTAGPEGGSAEKLSPEQNREAVKQLRKAVYEKYSYWKLHKVDWNKLFKQHGPKLEAAETPSAFAREAAKLLANAKDLHVTVGVGEMRLATHRRQVDPNYNEKSLSKAVPNWTVKNNCVTTGRFDDGIGYIRIAHWSREQEGDVRSALGALDELKDTKAMIVDVRPNSGGDELLAMEVASRFVKKRGVYSKNCYRDASAESGWGPVYDRVIEPSKDGPIYDGKVAVLMGRANMSSCESFLLMMKQAPDCKLIGEKSFGSSGNPKPTALSNGVTVYLSSWKDMLPDGAVLEGKGIKPDIAVEASADDFEHGDPVLSAALNWLRKGSKKE